MEVREVTITPMASSDCLLDKNKVLGSSGIDWIDNTAMERDNGIDERNVKFLLLRSFETTDTDDHE